MIWIMINFILSQSCNTKGMLFFDALSNLGNYWSFAAVILIRFFLITSLSICLPHANAHGINCFKLNIIYVEISPLTEEQRMSEIESYETKLESW